MTWDYVPEFEERGPLNYRYNYYFPKGCYGFGLNIEKYGDNQNWISMDGNDEDWRILFHETKNADAVVSIVKNSLKPGPAQAYSNHDCINEFGKIVKVGKGIYFSDSFKQILMMVMQNQSKFMTKNFQLFLCQELIQKKLDRVKE